MKKLITIAAILTLSGTAYADNDFHSAGSGFILFQDSSSSYNNDLSAHSLVQNDLHSAGSGFILFQDSRVSTVATTGAQPSVGSSSVNYDNLFWGGAEG